MRGRLDAPGVPVARTRGAFPGMNAQGIGLRGTAKLGSFHSKTPYVTGEGFVRDRIPGS